MSLPETPALCHCTGSWRGLYSPDRLRSLRASSPRPLHIISRMSRTGFSRAAFCVCDLNDERPGIAPRRHNQAPRVSSTVLCGA